MISLCDGISGKMNDGVVADVQKEDKVLAHDTDGESFTVVKGRRNRRKQKGKLAGDLCHDLGNSSAVDRDVTESKADVLRKLNNCTNLLRSSEYYLQFVDKIRTELPEAIGCSVEGFNVLCLGLGPFSSHLHSRISRYQLALLVLLKEEFRITVEVYDPVFSDQEKLILTVELGFHVPDENEEGRRVVESPTLLFMPHCPHQLVNNLLYSNWDPKLLNNCYLVCNSLSEAVSTIPAKYLNKNLFYLPKAQSVCKEIDLPNTLTEHSDVFNDIALHVFPAKNFVNVNEDFWLDKPTPVYTNKDFISNESATQT